MPPTRDKNYLFFEYTRFEFYLAVLNEIFYFYNRKLICSLFFNILRFIYDK